MTWMAFARAATRCAFLLVLAAGCGSADAGGDGGNGGRAGSGGESGSGGVPIPDGCENAVAFTTTACITDVSEVWRNCYEITGGPCETDDPAIETALTVLGEAVGEACEDGEFSSLSVEAVTERAQVACRSEALSLQSRTYGGPQGAAWASATGANQGCLLSAHESATAFVEDVAGEYNRCLASGHCDPEATDEAVALRKQRAAAEIDASCNNLASLIALDDAEYLDRAEYQADCVVATTHTETPGTNLSCGPTRAPETLPRGEYVQVILDGEEWGTLCGDGSDFAFQVRLAPEGEPLENIIVGMEGGGVCVLEEQCRDIDPALLESLTSVAPTSGVFSNDPEENPFANWTKVFVPYCTQDTFAGGGAVQEFSDFSIARYGAVNVRAATQYVRNLIWRLKDAEGGDGYRPDHVLAMFGGWSAGGFGALYNYHYVLDDLQWTSTAAFSDSALALDSMEPTSVPSLGFFAILFWDAQPILPPYCFENTCAVGPVLYDATAPRLKAEPNQQLMILSNQNDDVQVTTTFFPSTESFINEERTTVCETRDLNGIHYFLTTVTESIHVVSLRDELYQGSVDGQSMADWLWSGAVANPNGVASRIEEGDYAMAFPGVQPFPCEVPP